MNKISTQARHIIGSLQCSEIQKDLAKVKASCPVHWGALIKIVLAAAFPEMGHLEDFQIMIILVAICLQIRACFPKESLLSFVEWYCGKAGSSAAHLQLGLMVRCFDVDVCKSHDSLKPRGFRQWLLTSLFVHEGRPELA